MDEEQDDVSGDAGDETDRVQHPGVHQESQRGRSANFLPRIASFDDFDLKIRDIAWFLPRA